MCLFIYTWDHSFIGNEFHELHSPRIATRNTHGTGCTLASCIAAELAKGSNMLSAVKVYFFTEYISVTCLPVMYDRKP